MCGTMDTSGPFCALAMNCTSKTITARRIILRGIGSRPSVRVAQYITLAGVFNSPGMMESTGPFVTEPRPSESVKNPKAPVAHARGSERMSRVERGLPNRDRKGDGAFADFFPDFQGVGDFSAPGPSRLPSWYPSHSRTGSRGYFGNLPSVADSWHK